jgi:hypothetical protein
MKQSILPISYAVLLFALPSCSRAKEFSLTDAAAKIQSPAITEASGLAVSPSNGSFLWVLNDSGAAADLHLMTQQGVDRGEIRIANAKNCDWEDLCSFTLGGQPYLLIADTGDNQSHRPVVTLYLLREPKLPAKNTVCSGSVDALSQINFRFEDGPRDCEAVAVDTVSQQIILISKRTQPPGIYTLPLSLKPPSRGDILTARRIGSIPAAALGSSWVAFSNQPVGMDFSPDRLLAAIVTYKRVFLFSRQPRETWMEAFSRKPLTLAPHHLEQAESVAFSKDGKSLYVVSEGKNSPLKVYQR